MAYQDLTRLQSVVRRGEVFALDKQRRVFLLEYGCILLKDLAVTSGIAVKHKFKR